MKDTTPSRLRGVAYLTLAGILGFTALGSRDISTKKDPAPILAEQSETDCLLEGPIYSGLRSGECAKYTRLAAEDLFRIKYPRANAWNIRKHPQIDEIRVTSKIELENLANDGRLRSGDRVAFFYPKSGYNDEAAKAGAGYTHVALVLEVKDGKIYFADQFGKEIRTRIDLDDILKRGNLEPRALLSLSGN